MKTDLFQSCGYCWVFQSGWHIECSTFRASSSRIWNKSIGIPSSPLALLIVLLPKPHLTSHSRMSGSRWVITPSWLSGPWRSFLYSSSVYSCYKIATESYILPNIFCFCEAPTISVLYWAYLCVKYSLGVSTFLEEISSFPTLFFSSISLHWSLRKAFLSLLAILWNSTFK